MDADEYEEEEETGCRRKRRRREIFVHYCRSLSCTLRLRFQEVKTVGKAAKIIIGCVNKTEGEEVYECESVGEGRRLSGEAGDGAPQSELLCFGNLLCQYLLLINGKQSE